MSYKFQIIISFASMLIAGGFYAATKEEPFFYLAIMCAFTTALFSHIHKQHTR